MKFVGPLHRIRMFLEEVARGEATGPVMLRKSDGFQDWCPLLNEIWEITREKPASDLRRVS